MKTEIEITEIVKRHEGKHLQFGNVPSWVNKTQQEGIELKAGIIKSFWIKDAARVYDEPISDAWGECLVEILATQKKEEVKKTEQVNTPQSVAVLEGIVPDTLTVPLLEKWKKMSTFERILMFQNTPADRIEKRKGRGGKEFNYVKGNFMDQEANIAFLYSMNSKIDGWHLDIAGVACFGSISFMLDGQLVTSSGVGLDEQEYLQGDKTKPIFTIAAMMKNAHTDMKKKALAAKGFNGDVYRGEV